MTDAQPANEDPVNLTDRVLVVLQSRFPHQFEIAVLTAQNELLAEKVRALDWEHDDDDDDDDDV